MPEACFAVGAADGGCESGPRAEVRRVGDPVDLADLGDDQHRGVAANTSNLGEDVDAVVGFRSLLDLLGGLGDLAVEVLDQRHQAVQAPAWSVAQLELDQELPAALAEQV